jgi:hypothetical protein
MLTCQYCNKEFNPTHYNQTKFCSRYCSSRYHTARVSPELRKKWGSTSYHRRKSDPNNIIHFLLKNAKARAVKKGLDFNLTEEDIILPEYCPVLGVKLSKTGRRYGYSLDRIDPMKGYTKENVWVISQLANAMKWDSTPEERLAFANWVLTSEGGQ